MNWLLSSLAEEGTAGQLRGGGCQSVLSWPAAAQRREKRRQFPKNSFSSEHLLLLPCFGSENLLLPCFEMRKVSLVWQELHRLLLGM